MYLTTSNCCAECHSAHLLPEDGQSDASLLGTTSNTVIDFLIHFSLWTCEKISLRCVPMSKIARSWLYIKGMSKKRQIPVQNVCTHLPSQQRCLGAPVSL